MRVSYVRLTLQPHLSLCPRRLSPTAYHHFTGVWQEGKPAHKCAGLTRPRGGVVVVVDVGRNPCTQVCRPQYAGLATYTLK